MKQEIIKGLEQFGLTEGDSKVYLALLELGESTVGEIEKKIGLQRTTIYFSLNKLLENGLVYFNKKNNIRFYTAIHPNKFNEILEQKQRDLKKLLPDLISCINQEKQESEVGTFQGYNSLRSLMNHRLDILHKGGTIYIINPSSVQPLEKYKTLWHNHDIKRIKKGIKLKIITCSKFREIIKKEYGGYRLREDRFIELESPTSIIVYGDYVQIAVYKGQDAEPINIRIHDEELAKFYVHYFELLWDQAKP